jgi:hypothetical protein
MKGYSESLKFFLIEKGVKFENEERNKETIDSEDLIKQLYLITEFHSKCEGYRPKIWNNMPDDRGTLARDFRNKVKILKKNILKLKDTDIENSFEEFLVCNSKEYITKAEKVLNIIEHKGYKQMIKRSMERNEICIKDSYFTNIWNDSGMVICNLKRSTLDVYENDAIYLLLKLKRKGYSFNWDDFIEKYCKNQNLNYYSQQYIYNMINFPYDFVKSVLEYFSVSKSNKEVFLEEKATRYINKIYNNR